MVKKKSGRPVKKIIKPISELPFEIKFDFVIGKSDKYKNNKKVIETVQKEIKEENAEKQKT